MQKRPCPDLVRAYHEAGHAVLDLVFGYGLAYCSIEPSETAEGVTRRIADKIATGHYLRILAAGEWAEYQSGHDFEAHMCDSGSEYDRLIMAPDLLRAAEFDINDEFIKNLPAGLTEEMVAKLLEGHQYIMDVVSRDFVEPGRLDLLHEIADLLMKHRTLPQNVLDDLNQRYPLQN